MFKLSINQRERERVVYFFLLCFILFLFILFILVILFILFILFIFMKQSISFLIDIELILNGNDPIRSYRLLENLWICFKSEEFINLNRFYSELKYF